MFRVVPDRVASEVNFPELVTDQVSGEGTKALVAESKAMGLHCDFTATYCIII